MKDNNNIDELFRKGMEHHYPFDEHLWAAVEGQLPRQQVRPVLWIFNLNSIALILMLFACAMIPTDNTRADRLNILSENSHPSNTTFLKKSTNISLNDLTTNQKTEKENNTRTPNSNGVNQSFKQNTSSVKPSQQKRETNVLENISPQPTTNNTSVRTVNKLSLINSDTEKENSLFSHSQSGDQSKEKSKLSLDTRKKGSKAFNQKLDFINSLGFEVLNSSNLLLGNPSFAVNKSERVPPRSSYYVELEMNQDINVEKRLTSSNQDLQKLKQDNEKSLSQTLIGLNFIKQRKSFIYGVGVHHSKYTERVSYLVDKEALGYNISYDTSYQLVSGNFNSNGVPVFLINQEINEVRNPTTVIINDEITSINTFKRIGIPVFIGVQQDYKNWVAELRSSLSFNYLYQSQGIYLTDNLDQVENINSGAQLESMILGNKNDLSIGYSFYEQFALGARYSLYQDLSSFTTGYESRIRNQSIGVWILWKPE